MRGQRFVRCPELLCGVRINLAVDDENERDVAGAIDAHRPSCVGRKTPPPTPKKKAKAAQ